MKLVSLICVVVPVLFLGCAPVTSKSIPSDYPVAISINTEKTLYDITRTKKETLDYIANAVVVKLEEDLKFKKTDRDTSDVFVDVNIKSYSFAHKYLLPPMHWIVFDVNIYDNKENKLLESKSFQNGHADIPDSVYEIVEQITELLASNI